MHRRWGLLVLCGATVATARAHAQAAPESAAQPWRFGTFVGAAHDSPKSAMLGGTRGRDHLFVGFQALTPILRAGPVRVSYAAQLLPVVVIRGRTAPDNYGGRRAADGQLPEPNVNYAFGASPFGLEVAVPMPVRSVSLYGATAGGGVLFGRRFPVPEGARMNFTLEYGGGLLVNAGGGRLIQLGYKYHHISNAWMAAQNPGLDGNVFYAGYQWTARLRK